MLKKSDKKENTFFLLLSCGENKDDRDHLGLLFIVYCVFYLLCL